MKKILCLDFDGVIHSYSSGWQGATVITDDIVDGFFDWAEQASKQFHLVIHSSRGREPGGIQAMQDWLAARYTEWLDSRGGEIKTPLSFEFTTEKPPAFLTIDDRALCFDGVWPHPDELAKFIPWVKRRGNGN